MAKAPIKTTPKPEVISYAQNREDVILHVLLPKVRKGFYIDIGANSPIDDSVTYYFYKQGWHGINVDANATHIAALTKERPRDVTIQAAVSDTPGSLTFRRYKGAHHGLSTLSDDIKKQLAKLPFTETTVPATTLSTIFKEHVGDRAVDFMKIDVEGFEYQVLAGNDWKKNQPKIIAIEANHVNADWRPLLTAAGYTKVFFDGLNEYYASRAYLPEIDFSVYPKIVLEGAPIVSWQEYQRRLAAIDPYQRQVDRLTQRLDQQKVVAAEAKARLQWASAHPLRFAAAKLYHYYIKRDRTRGNA